MPENRSFISLIRLLGTKGVIRIGGNSSDRPSLRGGYLSAGVISNSSLPFSRQLAGNSFMDSILAPLRRSKRLRKRKWSPSWLAPNYSLSNSAMSPTAFAWTSGSRIITVLTTSLSGASFESIEDAGAGRTPGRTGHSLRHKLVCTVCRRPSDQRWSS